MGDIIFLAHRMPFPPDRGDKIRSHHLLKFLAERGNVHVGCFADTDADMEAEDDLARMSKSHCLVRRTKPLVLAGAEAVISQLPVSLAAFHSRALERWVRDTVDTHEIEAIFVFSGQMGQYVPDDFTGRVIVDLCDVDSVKFEDYAKAGERVWLNGREGRLLAREEERLAHRANATILISESEKTILQGRLKNAAGTRLHAIGNGIDAEYFDPASVLPEGSMTERSGPHFVFTGQMDYRPNELASLWAIEHFLPEVRAYFPEAEYHVVGRNPTEALLAKNSIEGATIWGEVPDVRPFLKAADVAVTPLTIARGVQNKVLEAMAMELPVLLTPGAATGIDAQDGLHWMVEEADAKSMADRFRIIWSEPSKLSGMGRAARQFVLDNHSWDAVLNPLEDLLLMGGRQRHAA
ncbi:Glycosyltransferase [Altererythrobacter epoxidivorans]|uniref:Glycosyltransferase n=1 Tax=Altererythrobacter epoxidivorans TaxID=361183 RepID=A0A0M3TAD5_9SPHN|nr:TIGR03087 family PEP-CTERM/XrtA system glycosyltransferase [Altererythrobacter epoxidivorans]ALE16586.1 Glycosyltransferase [Altererythrobacter epoxidivorans]